MDDLKKRKLEDNDENIDGRISTSTTPSEEQLRSLLEPLAKSQLVDLLAKLGSKYSPVAGEILNVATADPVHRKLFVRGLAWNTTSETLCAAFQVHGEIEEGAVITDKVTGKSRGYGFITYKHMESTQEALRAPSKLIDGRMAVCNLACEGLSSANTTPDQAQRKLYIGGLSPDITSEMLLSFFGRHGEIEEGSVAYDKETTKSRGFGFVTYKTVEAAKRALDDPERTFGGRNITVKFADTKSTKGAQLQLPPAAVPMAAPMGSGYQQPTKAPTAVPPLGYGYPQGMPSYPYASYPSPPAAPGPYPPPQPQMPYPSMSVKREPLGVSSQMPMGLTNVKREPLEVPSQMPMGYSGYPSYMAKQ